MLFRSMASRTGDPPFEARVFCLCGGERKALYKRIDDRFDRMIESGLAEECKELYNKGLEKTPTASQAIGYKELFPCFRGEISMEKAVESAKQASRNYAKRQMTYFRRINGMVMLDTERVATCKTTVNIIEEHLTNSGFFDTIM